MIAWFGSPPVEGEEWKDDAGNAAEPKLTALEFVCDVTNPREVSAAIRKDPLSKYVLFRGEMMDVSVAMPVFVNGKNLDTLNDEWSQAPETT